MTDQQPLGQRFSFGDPFQAPGFEIVGVVGDSKYYDLREKPQPMAFTSAWQLRNDGAYPGDLVLRTSLTSSAIMPEVRPGTQRDRGPADRRKLHDSRPRDRTSL